MTYGIYHLWVAFMCGGVVGIVVMAILINSKGRDERWDKVRLGKSMSRRRPKLWI